MSKHTTLPMVHLGYNSHTNTQEGWDRIGNWNRHKVRRVPSGVRTLGRLARHLRRTQGLFMFEQEPLLARFGAEWLDARIKAADAHNQTLWGQS